MKVNLYKRHGSNCRLRKPGDKQDKDRAHRCQRSVWLEYRVNGVQLGLIGIDCAKDRITL